MTVSVLNRVTVAVAVSAVALFGLSAPASARPQQGQKHQEDQKGKNQGQAKKQQRLASQDQQALISQQQQRLGQYREHLDQQQRAAQQHATQLQQAKRAAQYSLQQQYMAHLRQQQLHVQQSQAHYNYAGDPYFSTPAAYRYSRGGHYYQTNQYGLNLLRQAVNFGYDEGVRAGLADRQDRWAFNYEESFAYQDANYGYTGFYVDRDDYNYYFREGYRRGYEDGYHGRYQYGTYSGGKGTILGAILASILTFEAIR
jgi:TolA-binding protein